MRVINNAQVVDDAWRLVDDGDVCLDGDVILSYRRWRDKPEAVYGAGRLAVWVDGDDDLDELSRHLQRFDLLAVNFPLFSDGRSFSVARQLREYYGYTGELRAVGDVARDQLLFMARCGIDSFALRDDADFDAALQAFKELSGFYQAPTAAALMVDQGRLMHKPS